jgi:hypothetical protein
MERICTLCHAVLAADSRADWCPACGGALTDRLVDPAFELAAATTHQSKPEPKPEIDHRGIVLPRRHALGGIITPQ